LRSITPAAGLAAIAAIVILVLAGSAIALLPSAFADPQGTPDVVSGGDPTIGAATILPTYPTESFAPVPTVYLVVPTLAPTPKPTPKPTAKPTAKPKVVPIPDTVAGARTYVKLRIGTKQYNCINYVWTRESKWNPRAGVPSGAYGIPQAFPGSKMAKFGSNWRTSPITQVKWGLWYVNDRYGSACVAYQFFLAHGWY
jgi:hypothetical protein